MGEVPTERINKQQKPMSAKHHWFAKKKKKEKKSLKPLSLSFFLLSGCFLVVVRQAVEREGKKAWKNDEWNRGVGVGSFNC